MPGTSRRRSGGVAMLGLHRRGLAGLVVRLVVVTIVVVVVVIMVEVVVVIVAGAVVVIVVVAILLMVVVVASIVVVGAVVSRGAVVFRGVVVEVVVAVVGLGWRGGTAVSACLIGRRRPPLRRDHLPPRRWIRPSLLRPPPSLSARWRSRLHLPPV